MDKDGTVREQQLDSLQPKVMSSNFNLNDGWPMKST